MDSTKKIGVFACILGNTLEWFDYALYGTLAAVMAHNFFPMQDGFGAQLSMFGVFAVGFLARPLGGVLFGHIGDKMGRKKALLISILLMTLPTTIIGLTPSYEKIGVIAPIILTTMRVMQGIAIGGEFTGSMVYLSELAPNNKRGFFSSWSDFSSPLGVLIGVFVTAILSSTMSSDSFSEWGWRLPMVLGFVLGLISFYFRTKIIETTPPKSTKASNKKIPLSEVFKNHKKTTLSVLFISAFSGVCFYLLLTFLPNFMVVNGIADSTTAFKITSFANLCMLMAIPISGRLSDTFGRKKILSCGILLAGLLAFPLFYSLSSEKILLHAITQGLFGTAIGIYFGGRAAFFSESFPTAIRYSAVSLAFGLSHSVFAGWTPSLAWWVSIKHGIGTTPWIIIIISFLAIVSLTAIKDRTGKDLLN